MFSYKQRYLKYKIKYETLKKKFNQTGGFISETLENVITYNDPFFSGTLLDGDIDDIISIIFLAIKFRHRLTIIIRNQEGKKRDINIECKNFLFLINKLYDCIIIYDNNLDRFDFTKHYDIGFVCAPMIDNVIALFNNLVAIKKTNVYVQGGTIGYNYVNSHNNGLGLTKNVIHLSSESTNGSLPLSMIDPIYTQNKFFKKINLYQLKKLFGLMPVHIPFATTVWLDKVDYPGWGNTGNSWKTYLRITELMTLEQRDILDQVRLDNRLINAYNNYISVIIDIKFNSIRNSNDFGSLLLTKDELFAYKKQILDRRDEVSDELKIRLYSVGKLMQRILNPDQIDNLYVKLCGEKKTEIIGEIAQVPELFEVEPELLPKTPALFDFNTTFGVINALDSGVISIFDPTSKEPKLELELETYIKGFEDTGLSIITDNFNGIIKQFINDIDLLDNEDEEVINAKKDFIMI